jgi:hypothetical protein
MAANGINALFSVTQMKNAGANDDAANGPGEATPSAPPPNPPKTTKLESDGPSTSMADLVQVVMHPIALRR